MARGRGQEADPARDVAGAVPDQPCRLELGLAQCLDDGEGTRLGVSEVHVSFAGEALLLRLRAAAGRRVEVAGEAFLAHSGHHHAPVVLFADEVRVDE